MRITFQLWHRSQPTFSAVNTLPSDLNVDYTHMCDLSEAVEDTSDYEIQCALERCFVITQNPTKEYKGRSTSVGDLLVATNYLDVATDVYVVHSIGFRKLYASTI